MSTHTSTTLPPPRGTPVDPAPPPVRTAPPAGLLARAKRDDPEAIATIFAQFVPDDEPLVSGHYLGVMGFWGIGIHSFAGVTPRRMVSLRISVFGGVTYQDGSLEYANSAVVFQPSRVSLYIYAAFVSLFFALVGAAIEPPLFIVGLLLSAVLFPFTVRLYYRLKKSGLLLWVREGVSLYIFIDRKRMRLANQLYRSASGLREERLRTVRLP